MNIRCPECQTVFRVDPQKIPPAGARARCARCGARFTVQRPAAQAGPIEARPTGTSARPGQPTPASPPPRPMPEPASMHQPRPAPSAARAAAPAGATATAAPPRPGANKDPNARAERLARALVSDIVAYHPDRRDRSLADGTLRTEFRDEIMKSWEEYVAQVGLPTAKSTPFFREALNTILARGQQIF